MAEWSLHYASWMIGDGEPDFEVGDVFDWRLVDAWSAEPLTQTDAMDKAAIPASRFLHGIVGRVMYRSSDACAIDLGPLQVAAKIAILPSDCSQGDYVRGVISLGLPLVTEYGPDVPVRAQRFKVRRVFADLTPYVEVEGGFVLDQSCVRHEEVSSTSAVRTHTYILQCEHVGAGGAIQVGSSGVLVR